MRFIVVRTVFVIVCLIVCRRTTCSQVTAINPAQPRWGQTLTITYDTAAAGAKFTADDELYVALRLSFPGYSENASARMTKVGKLFKAEFPIKESLSNIAVHFIALDGGWDEAAYTTAMIYRADGKPARGACAGRINARRYRELFDQEIAPARPVGEQCADFLQRLRIDLAALGRARRLAAPLAIIGAVAAGPRRVMHVHRGLPVGLF